MKLTALLCFPKHTKTFFSLSAIFTKAPPLGEIFESIPPQSPTLMRGGGGNSIDRCIKIMLASLASSPGVDPEKEEGGG